MLKKVYRKPSVRTVDQPLISAIGMMGYDAAAVALSEPVKCACGRLAYFVVNRMGITRCVDCDSKGRRDESV